MRSIVVGLQGRPEPEPALEFALEESRRRGLTLEVVHAYSVPSYGGLPPALAPGSLRAARHAAERAVAAAVERAEPDGAGARLVRVRVVEGDPVAGLLSVGDAAALVVVGTHGRRRLARTLRGSVSAACLQRCQAPLVVVPDRVVAPAYRWLSSRVVVGFDGSRASLSALAWATEQAREWGSPLIPVVVLGPDEQPPPSLRGSSNLSAQVWRLVNATGCGDLEVHPRFTPGLPVQALRDAVRAEDLLVLGARERGRVAGLIVGSTGTSVAESAVCPVVVVRAGQARREIHQHRAQRSLV